MYLSIPEANERLHSKINTGLESIFFVGISGFKLPESSASETKYISHEVHARLGLLSFEFSSVSTYRLGEINIYASMYLVRQEEG